MTDYIKNIPCPECHKEGVLRVEIRERIVARPIGTYSLAGNQLKVSANKVPWPYLACTECGYEEAGKPDDE